MTDVAGAVERVVVVGAGIAGPAARWAPIHRMLEVLGHPVHGRLLLAGEHTHAERNGYADGAYVCGL